MRPRLAGSEAAQSMMEYLLNAEVMFPPTPAVLRPARWAINKALRYATIATMPPWMRKLAGLRQSRLLDAAITPVMRVAFRISNANPRLKLLGLRMISPSTVAVAAPALLGLPPRQPETLTPAEARSRYGVLPPTEEYARFRQLIAGKTGTPDAANVGPEIADSQAVLGPVA